jgi:hypothetical protein
MAQRRKTLVRTIERSICYSARKRAIPVFLLYVFSTLRLCVKFFLSRGESSGGADL